jgi:hypothetical protein
VVGRVRAYDRFCLRSLDHRSNAFFGTVGSIIHLASGDGLNSDAAGFAPITRISDRLGIDGNSHVLDCLVCLPAGGINCKPLRPKQGVAPGKGLDRSNCPEMPDQWH